MTPISRTITTHPTLATARRAAAGLAAIAMLAALPACGSSDTASTNSSPGASSTASSNGAVELRDPYVKAEKASGEMAMSAIFGTLNNTSDGELTVVKATSDVADSVELHEFVTNGGKMKMQQRPGGFVLPSQGSIELEPGGFHIMLIGLKRDIRPGDAVQVTMDLSDGSTVTAEATGRDMSNGEESYAPEDSAPSDK